MQQQLAAIAAEPYASLTTFRRDGTPVATAVWLAPEGEDIVVTTTAQTGKVKRLRHTPRAQLRPCSRTGQVAEGAPVTEVDVRIETAPAQLAAGSAALAAKYGVQFRAFGVMERVAGLVRRREAERVILRMRAADEGAAATD